MTRQQQRPPLAFCGTCNARERAIVAGRCIVCGNPPKAEACPYTGRSASVCDSPDHRNCPDLRPKEAAR